MRKLLLLVAATFSLSAMAYDIANYQYEGTTFNFNYPSADDHSQLTLVNIGNYSQDLIIPDKVDGVPVTVIASNALYDKPYRNLLLPRSLREIQENAILSSSSDFTTLIIPENVEKIGSGDGNDFGRTRLPLRYLHGYSGRGLSLQTMEQRL